MLLKIRRCQKVIPCRKKIKTECYPSIWVDVSTPHGWLRRAFLRSYLNRDLNEKVKKVWGNRKSECRRPEGGPRLRVQHTDEAARLAYSE